MSHTLGQTWEEWALEEGERRKAEGEIAGTAKGEIQTRREDLRVLLEEKFGSLPDELIQRIETATDPESLKACLRQTLRIQSLDELNL